jgi:hypothetical protein
MVESGASEQLLHSIGGFPLKRWYDRSAQNRSDFH